MKFLFRVHENVKLYDHLSFEIATTTLNLIRNGCLPKWTEGVASPNSK